MVKKTVKSSKAKSASNPMWGGHFTSGPAEAMAAINNSLAVDQALWEVDVQGSLAHATMLGKQGIISARDAAAIEKGLKQIRQEFADGHFPFREELEDIHMNIEARLKDIIGDAAGRLHTARSRNDQVATDLRLWLRGAIDALDDQLKTLLITLAARAGEHAGSIMPGFTHLQAAQPITLGHHLLAYAEMLTRDRARLIECRARLNES